MNEAARIREAQRIAALGGIDPGRLALSPSGREYLAAVAQQRAASEAARLQAQREEEARRAAASRKIRGLKSKTRSGREVAESRITSLSRSYSDKVQRLETELRTARADLQLAIERGDDLRIRDMRQKIASIESNITAARADPQFQQSLELARDLYYFSNPAGSLLGDDAGSLISDIFNISATNVQRRQQSERRRQEKLSDTSTMAFRSEYRKKYGVDPLDVKVVDKRGREVSLTKLGRISGGIEGANKYVIAVEESRAAQKKAISQASKDAIEKYYATLKEQGLVVSGATATYDANTNMITVKAKGAPRVSYEAERSPDKFPNLFTITEQPAEGRYVDARMNLMFGSKPLGDWLSQSFESKVKSGEYKLDPKTGEYFSTQTVWSVDPFKQASEQYAAQQKEISRQTSAAVQKWKAEQAELGYSGATISIYDKGKAPTEGYGGPTLLVDKGDKTYAYSVRPSAGKKQYEYRATDPTNPFKIEKVEVSAGFEKVERPLPPDDAFAGFANVYGNLAKTYYAGFVNAFDPVQARQWQLRKNTAPIIEREIVGDAITDIGVPVGSKALENLQSQISGGKIDAGATRSLINTSVTDYARVVSSRPQYYFGSSLAEASMWINPLTLPAKISSLATKGARAAVTVSEAISAAAKSTKAVEAGELGFKSSGKIGSPEVYKAIQQERPAESLFRIWTNYENKPITSALARLFGQQPQKVAPIDTSDIVKVTKQYERAPTNRLEIQERPSVLGQRQPIPIDEELEIVKLFPEQPVPKRLPSLDDIAKRSPTVRAEGAPFKPSKFPVEENVPFFEDIVKKNPPLRAEGAPFKPSKFPIEENAPFIEDIVKKSPPRTPTPGAPVKEKLFPVEQSAPSLESILRKPYKLAGTEVTELEARLGDVARAERAASDPRNILSRIKLPRTFVRRGTTPKRVSPDEMSDLFKTLEGRERPGVARDDLTREQMGRLAGTDADDLGISGFRRPRSLLERSLSVKKDAKTGELIFGAERILAPRPIWSKFGSGKPGGGKPPSSGAPGPKVFTIDTKTGTIKFADKSRIASLKIRPTESGSEVTFIPKKNEMSGGLGTAFGGGPSSGAGGLSASGASGSAKAVTEGAGLQLLYPSKQGIPPGGKPPASGRPGIGKAGRAEIANPLGLLNDLTSFGSADASTSARDVTKNFGAESMSRLRSRSRLDSLLLQNVQQKPQSRQQTITETRLDSLSLSLTLQQFAVRQERRTAQAPAFPTVPLQKAATVRASKFKSDFIFAWPTPPPEGPPRRPPWIRRGPDDAKGKRESSRTKFKPGERRYKEADILGLFFGNYFAPEVRKASDYDAQDELIDYYAGRS